MNNDEQNDFSEENPKKIRGYVHSIETFATADGPGTRLVVFMQGCKFRCVYCHNPDSWQLQTGERLTAEQIVKKTLRYKPYYGEKGGITLSGGEPLVQSEFATEIFSLCKQNQIHTALDTAGSRLDNSVKELLEYTDLVLLDIKHCQADKFKQITGCPIQSTIDFLDYITEIGKKFWVRQVVAPGINDCEEDIIRLASLLQGRENLDKIELLPYHTLGVEKWQALGISYPLAGASPITAEKISELTKILKRHNLPI